MRKEIVAARIYAVVSFGVIAFQIALALGAPWGAYAMGGAFPGQFPPELRVAAFMQAMILGLLARAGITLPKWSRTSRWLVWVVVAFSALSLVLNLITPSARERAIWAPVALIMLISSVIVAVSKPAK
jgi:peptidoglycan/LPS O-acetylase OafA/YrhL